MHPKIKKFWEDTGGHVWVQTVPDAMPGVTNVPTYWFDKNNSTIRIMVACPFNEQIVYYDAALNRWCTETEMLRIIKMKAFL